MLTSENTNGPIVLVSKNISFTFPFGYAYLAGYLIQQGEKNVKILFKPEDPLRYKSFIKEIMSLKPVLVGFGSLYPDLYSIRELITILNKEKRDFPIVIGGQMVTPTPEFAMEITKADYGVIGEGEITLYKLVSTLREQKSPFEIKGLAIREGKNITLTGKEEYIEDMSKLPPVPYDLIPSKKWLNIGRYYVNKAQPHWRFNDRVVAIHGGRGCPFRCNFCYHHSKPRYRTVSNMMAEANELIKRYNANMLYFGDDLVLSSPQRAKELTESIVKLCRPVEYSVSCRFDILNRMDDELLCEMKRTGCRIMGLGIESGSQRILDIMDKKITVENILTGMRRLKDASILPTVSIMVGQLTETVEDVQKSIDLMLKTLRYDKNINYAFTITTPFPGTELYSIALKNEVLKNNYDFYQKFDANKQFGKVSINLSNMSDEKVEEMLQKLNTEYTKEKRKQIGNIVNIIEFCRNLILRIYNKINKIIFDKLPDNKMFLPIKKLYNLVYELTQITLDKLRLYALGIYKIDIKKLIKKITPKFLIKLSKKIISSFAGRHNNISGNYKILKKPNFNELKIKYSDTWKNNSIPREQIKLTKQQLQNFQNIPPMKSLIDLLSNIETSGKKLLEIGCSTGYYSEIFKKAGIMVEYEGCDYSKSFIKLAEETYPGINFKVCDATMLNYGDNQFDIVISGCCILHIIDYQKAISEAIRISKKYVLFHRTPILHNHKTTFLTKTGYGVEMLEIFFNEKELINFFNQSKIKIKKTDTHAQFLINGLDEPVLMKSYLCKKYE